LELVLGAGWIVHTYHVGGWRVRDARAAVGVKLMMAYYMAEKKKKLDFPLKDSKVMSPKWQKGNGVRNI
jgi:hypothetical protein